MVCQWYAIYVAIESCSLLSTPASGEHVDVDSFLESEQGGSRPDLGPDDASDDGADADEEQDSGDDEDTKYKTFVLLNENSKKDVNISTGYLSVTGLLYFRLWPKPYD